MVWGGSAWPQPRPDGRVRPRRQEKRKRQAEVETKRRQLEDDRRQLQHLKVLSGQPQGPPRAGLAGEGAAASRDPGLGLAQGLGGRKAPGF